ncbi:DUF2490 domain-containing protein [Algoriphagus taiwanensis]|uniref:DUF2490 domain-containing protein n=1 Tax=Algoriphagus taiwanensis TaxID=1445656 RepID=A0ABQ6PZA1_9BACT|nr:hypothetical protein Ataiwa_15210 [Algoriphagus taiwanensis]
MKKPGITGILLLLFLSLSFRGFSQEKTNQKALWYGYTFHVPLTNKWYNETEVMERHLVDPLVQSQFFIRTRFHKKISPFLNYGLGGSMFLFHIPTSSDLANFNLPELRPQGELNLHAKVAGISLTNRLRGELRFFQNTNPEYTESEPGFNFTAARIRYRLQAILPLANLKDEKSLKLKIANEIMAMGGGDLEELAFDQNRISADLSFSFSSALSLDLGYVNWHQSKTHGGYLDQHILRTVVKHQLKSAKK